MQRFCSPGICLLVAIVALAPPARAGDYLRNAWGIYAAPTMYGFAQGTRWDLAASGNALDVGAYYTRFFARSWSAQLEVRLEQRQLDDTISGAIDFLPPNVFTMFRLDEEIIEVPLVVHNERRIIFGDHEARLAMGGGVVYAAVLDQKLLDVNGESTTLTAGDYQKFGWLLDGGFTLGVDPRHSCFARFRYQRDESVFGESDDADVQRRFEAWGMLVGLESGF